MQTKFLICEDHKIRLQEIRQFLSNQARYTIIENFTNGRDMIEWVRQNKGVADILILDIIMPVMDGYAAFFELKEVDPKLKVIFVTVENSPPLMKELIKNGASGFLTKPLDRDKFLSVVAEAARRD